MPHANYKTCTSVSELCPVSSTTYGYYPNLAGNLILCIVFGICLIFQIIFSIKGRTWTWMIGLVLGCGGELAGYLGRISMHFNPWNNPAYETAIITLVLAPSFIAASIDLTLKHLVIRFGPQYSLIRPPVYTWFFITLEFFAIIVQAAGGGAAAAATAGEKNDLKVLLAGDHIILAGIALQIAQLVTFGAISGYYAWNVRRHWQQDETKKEPIPFRLKFFIACIAGAYSFILIRCIYRMPEMAGGWGGPVQRNEPIFLVFDGACVAAASILLTIAHPTLCFPQMGKAHHRGSEDGSMESAEEMVDKAMAERRAW